MKWMPNIAGQILLVLATTGCGAGDSKEREDTPGSNGSGDEGDTVLLLNDESAASAAASVQWDEAVARAVEDHDQDSNNGFALAAAAVEGQVTLYRSCTAEGDNAVVTIVRSVDKTRTVEGPRRIFEATLKGYMEKTRTWSKEDTTIGCAADGRHAAVPIADMVGVTLDVDFTHNRERTLAITTKATSAVVTRTLKQAENAERHVSWLSVTSENDQLVIKKELTGNAERTFEFEKKDGSTISLSGTIANIEGSPLEVTVVRNATTFVPVSRTIDAGALETKNQDGGRMTMAFSGVKFVPGSCRPTAGTVTGEIYVKDATTPSATFTITFSDDDGDQIAFSSGTKADFLVGGCELEVESDNITEKDARTEVTDPAS